MFELSVTKFQIIRDQLGLSRADFASVLGYSGSYDTRRQLIAKFENGTRTIPPAVQRLAYALYMLRRIPQELKPDHS